MALTVGNPEFVLQNCVEIYYFEIGEAETS